MFSDRVDATMTISLFEYGLIRNPQTNKTIFCDNCHELDMNFGTMENRHSGIVPCIRVEYIDFDDVKSELENVSKGYFSFIGSTREKELKELDNEYLTSHIMSLIMYNGTFGKYW